VKLNRVPACQGCRYNTSKNISGGLGRTCNGGTMQNRNRCPEWAINLYMQEVHTEVLSMHDVVQYFKLKKEIS